MATVSNEILVEPESPTSPTEEAFDQSTLSIKQTKGIIKDVWQRENPKPLPDSPTLVTRFEIPYARVLADEQNTSKKYVVYDLAVRQDSSTVSDKNATTIERRYTDFLNLYEALKKEHYELLQCVAFPKKVMMGNFNAELIAERALAFENFLDYLITVPKLRESIYFLSFIQDDELNKACKLLDERRNELAVPILENCFQLVNKIYLDKSRPVLLLLCRLVSACASPIPHPASDRWADLALRRYEHVSDIELLVLYIPLLHTCANLFWQKGRDPQMINNRLEEMGKRGIKIKNTVPLSKALHALDKRSETA